MGDMMENSSLENIVSKKKMGWFSKTLLTVTMITALTGCVTTGGPTTYFYPKQNQTMEAFYKDKANCEYWAKQQAGSPGGEVAQDALIGAVGGAGLGAIIGALTGNAGTGAAFGAGAGALGGGLYGASKGQGNYNEAFRACMRSKGYIGGY